VSATTVENVDSYCSKPAIRPGFKKPVFKAQPTGLKKKNPGFEFWGVLKYAIQYVLDVLLFWVFWVLLFEFLNAVHFKYWINAEVNKKSSALVL